MMRKGVTESFGAAIHALSAAQLTDAAIQRSKRMVLDTLGVGLLGSRTPVARTALRYSQMFRAEQSSSVWGEAGVTLPPQYAAFVNGVAVHSMDFDDTWHPATHPSAALLPALLAIAEARRVAPSGLELLLAFNVGVEVQGRLLGFSREAHDIPRRFHPPSVVGVMGSAAASAKLLGLSPAQCLHALAIAASSAGAPLANAATQTKPLHAGYAASRGLGAARLAQLGLRGNPDILDLDSGFGVFYGDYRPAALEAAGFRWLLEAQDVAFKRMPCHLGTHWAADAALGVRARLEQDLGCVHPGRIRRVTLRVPPSKYVDCPAPASEHQARHSFQFVACSALLDGAVSPASFADSQRLRPALTRLLDRVRLETPEDNRPCFDSMYCEVVVETEEGRSYAARCDTFYGHWRKPLSQRHLEEKFRNNASSVLSGAAVEQLIHVIANLETQSDASSLTSLLRTDTKKRNNATNTA